MTTYGFTFVISGIPDNRENEEEFDRIATTIHNTYDEVSLSCCQGQWTLWVEETGSDAVDAARSVLTRLGAALPELAVHRLDYEMVPFGEIVHRTGVAEFQVRWWIDHGGGPAPDLAFPAPAMTSYGVTLWQWTEVNEWLKPLGLADEDIEYPTWAQWVAINYQLPQWMSGARSRASTPG